MGKLACLPMFGWKHKDKLICDKMPDRKSGIIMNISPSLKSSPNSISPQTTIEVSDAPSLQKGVKILGIEDAISLQTQSNGSEAVTRSGDTKDQVFLCETSVGRSGGLVKWVIVSDGERSLDQPFDCVLRDVGQDQDPQKESPASIAFMVEEKSSDLTSVFMKEGLSDSQSRRDLVAEGQLAGCYCDSHQSISCEGYEDGLAERSRNRSGHLSDPGLYFAKDLESASTFPSLRHALSSSRLGDEVKLERKNFMALHILDPCSYHLTDPSSSPLECFSENQKAYSVSNDSVAQKYDKFETLLSAKDQRQVLSLPSIKGLEETAIGSPHCYFLRHESVGLPVDLENTEGVNNTGVCHMQKVDTQSEVSNCLDTILWSKDQTSFEQTQASFVCPNSALPEDLEGFTPSTASFANIGSSVEIHPLKETVKASIHSGFKRIEEWVNSVDPVAIPPDEERSKLGAGHDSPVLSKRPQESRRNGDLFQHEDRVVLEGPNNMDANLISDLQAANAAARSITTMATIAHLSGLGLRVAPLLGAFNNLKSLNLSANAIGRIFPGSLPKNLHHLDLSRNRITAIEGLRELSRLRVLNLSHNRISRIGQGLASCPSLRELRLADNKIKEIEGLHRLVKLCYLDLSFNKLTTTKSLGQLSANYSSLQALDLTGNAVHTTLGEEQLRKFISGLLPGILYLNKQTIKAAFAKEGSVGHNIGRLVHGSPSNQRPTKSGSKIKMIAAPKMANEHQRRKKGYSKAC